MFQVHSNSAFRLCPAMPRPNTHGFSPDDIRRIQRMAEDAASSGDVGTVALDDLSVPYRVGCCAKGWETRYSGDVLGEWAGMCLLVWAIEPGRPMSEWKARVSGARP